MGRMRLFCRRDSAGRSCSMNDTGHLIRIASQLARLHKQAYAAWAAGDTERLAVLMAEVGALYTQRAALGARMADRFAVPGTMTVAAAAEYMGTAKGTIFHWIAAGTIRKIERDPSDHHTRVYRADVIAAKPTFKPRKPYQSRTFRAKDISLDENNITLIDRELMPSEISQV